MTFVLLVFMLMQPLFGALSDKVGRKTMMMGFGGISILTTIPLMTVIGSVQSSTWAFIYIVIALAVVSMYTSSAAL